MESLRRQQKYFQFGAEKLPRRASAARVSGRKNAQATMCAACVKVAKAPGTNATKASMRQLNRISIEMGSFHRRLATGRKVRTA
jgi:hypothetical protein